MTGYTSISNPIHIDVIGTPLWPGRLGLTIAPGKVGSMFGKTHQRDLNADLKALRAQGADSIVNLMEDDEQARWRMHGYDDAAEAAGLSVRRYPIPDMNIPSDPASFRTLVEEVYADLQAGTTVVVHCLGGLGRSGTLAACVLMRAGMNADSAISHVRHYRKGAIEARQPEFIRAYAVYSGGSAHE
ncbi:cyclin-dependent kinase inhibitor 3 family protein [Deinococcus sp.]|uniref:cyclin-dependent kinase inhibitor 3 family protein n=1 Tax=Deinococcus sp. TaxID=47478 RepID=UPI003CC58DBE